MDLIFFYFALNGAFGGFMLQASYLGGEITHSGGDLRLGRASCFSAGISVCSVCTTSAGTDIPLAFDEILKGDGSYAATWIQGFSEDKQKTKIWHA